MKPWDSGHQTVERAVGVAMNLAQLPILEQWRIVAKYWYLPAPLLIAYVKHVCHLEELHILRFVGTGDYHVALLVALRFRAAAETQIKLLRIPKLRSGLNLELSLSGYAGAHYGKTVGLPTPNPEPHYPSRFLLRPSLEIMEFLEGDQLESVWANASVAQKKKLLRDYADVMIRLKQNAFSKVGILRASCSGFEVAAIPKTFSRTIDEAARLGALVNYGPYATWSDYRRARIDAGIYIHSRAKNKETAKSIIHNLELISHHLNDVFASDSKTAEFYPIHPDVHQCNILVRNYTKKDQDYSISGVIDWDGCYLGPLSHLARYPFELSSGDWEFSENQLSVINELRQYYIDHLLSLNETMLIDEIRRWDPTNPLMQPIELDRKLDVLYENPQSVRQWLACYVEDLKAGGYFVNET